MKRVLHIVGGMNRAGAETMIMNIYRVLDKSVFQFDFLVYNNDKQDYEDEIISLGGRVIHAQIKRGLIGGIKSIGVIRRIIKEYGPYCAIHAATLHNSAFALLAASGIKNCKKIVHSHNTTNTLNPSLSKKIYNSVTRLLIKNLSDEYIACGQEAGYYLFGKDLFNRKGVVINNSVDLDKFFDINGENIQKLRKEFGISTSEIVIGSVARLSEVKNHKRMLKIASEMKQKGIEFKVIFVGRGELESNLKEEMISLGLDQNVIFAGVRSDIPNLMHLFDVFLMPSFFEGNPVTLIEAQAAGLPVVISDTITDRIDMDLGLVTKVSLNDDDNKWINALLQAKSSVKSFAKEDIYSQLSDHGYNLQHSTKLLCKLYS